MKRNYLTSAVLALLVLAGAGAATSAWADEEAQDIRRAQVARYGKSAALIGIYPGTATETEPHLLLQRFLPAMNYLTNRVGGLVSFVPEVSSGRFKESIAAGQYNLIYVTPEIGVTAWVNGFTPLVKRSEHIESVAIVKKDSPAKEMKDIKRLGVLSGAMVTSLAIATLKKDGLIGKTTLVPLGASRQDSFSSLDSGAVEASITRREYTLDPSFSKSYRVLANTGSAPGFMLMARDDVSKELKDKLTQAFLELDYKGAGRDIIFGMENQANSGYEKASVDDLVGTRQALEIVEGVTNKTMIIHGKSKK